MRINDLPDDILAVVLRAALPATRRQLADVKGGLELLAVCRRWQDVVLPTVFDTVFIVCGTLHLPIYDRPESENIATTLDQVVGAMCHPIVRRLVVDVHYQADPFPGLKAVISRMHGAGDKWLSVRKLEVRLHAGDWDFVVRDYLEPNRQEDISSVSSELSALLPGLREIRIDCSTQTQAILMMFGRLVAPYANQLQVLHSEQALVVPQDCVFAQLRDVMIDSRLATDVNYQLPRLNAAAIESLVLKQFTANEVWSMFCANPDDHAITFPRLRNLRLEYLRASRRTPRQLNEERPWALQFPAAKRVRIVCNDAVCPSMENAVFPTRLESLDISAGLGLHQAIARAKVQVSQSLVLGSWRTSIAANTEIATRSRIFAAAGHCKSTTLTIDNRAADPLELLTYSGLMNLRLNGLVSAYNVLHHIRTQSCLVSLTIEYLTLDAIKPDFSIPMCAEHEPVAPLDTQLREFTIQNGFVPESPMLAVPMLKYLLLKIPTLRCVSAPDIPEQPIRDFIAGYVQWYPHLANVKLVTRR